MSDRVWHCVHDRVREGCVSCDRLELAQRTAALSVLGLEPEDLERLADLRRLARSDRGGRDGRTAMQRIRTQATYARSLAAGHLERSVYAGGLDRADHQTDHATWATEAAVLEGLLELLGSPLAHDTSVDAEPEVDQR